LDVTIIAGAAAARNTRGVTGQIDAIL